MIPLSAGGVFRQYGDGRFYKTPALKATLVGVSACSILYRVLAVRTNSPRLLLWSVRLWACPNAGVWLVAVLILIFCRPLERQVGAGKFTRHLFSSVVGGLVLAASIYAGSVYNDNFLPIPPGAIFHVMTGSLAWLYYCTVFPLHTLTPLPFLTVTSNTILYLLTGIFSCSSPEAGLLTFCGLVGATIQQGLGSLPLPSLPPRLVTWISHLLDTEGAPPATLSGATLAVQREQRMDQLEQMMASFQHNRLRVVLQRNTQQRPSPSPEQVAQLVVMGFPQNEVRQALVATGNDTAAAVQLLTSRNLPPHS
ncbi:Ubiquitin-associated domain-containing protein 2 [Geodia barretti]|uniref:Ubiquitin-associated domain-containing protein 2 n=2 Tax=Geodia barretti TaxID=519541 RepID=A0AA35X7B4_GEOBA|nr:Ubiquitin-associated domain-containing protein 2 [Geodia barretti]